MADVAPSRLGVGSLVAAITGLGVSLYLSVEHYSASTPLACPESAALNCQRVTTSQWSQVGPIPVAVLGLAFFAAMSALCSPPAWRLRSLDPVRVAGSGLGVAAALYLVWIELFRIDAICLWCTAAHLCALVLLATVLWTVTLTRSP